MDPTVLDEHPMLILHTMHCGFLAYKPDLAWWLFELTVLLAVKARVLIWLADRVEDWNQASAAEVVSELDASLGYASLTAGLAYCVFKHLTI